MLRTRGTGSAEGNVISESERRNRRDLLFGARRNNNTNNNGNTSISGRPNGNVSSEQEAIEASNEEKVGNLSGQVHEMRHIAININEEVLNQNRYLDGMNNQMGHAGDMLNNSLRALRQLSNGAGGLNMCMFVVFAFFFLLAIRFLYR